jgi:hypothetical protein
VEVNAVHELLMRFFRIQLGNADFFLNVINIPP